MYSSDNQVEHKMQGDSLQECRDKLFQLYGKDYKITSNRVVTKSGFFGLFSKPVVEVTYAVIDYSSTPVVKSTPVKSFEASRNEILEKSSVNPYNLLKKIEDSLDAKIASITDTMGEQIKEMQKQNNFSDKHPTILKIEELLADNEFSLSFINKISQRIRQEFPLEMLDDFKAVEKAVIDWIGKDIKIYRPKVVKLPHVIILVGPTGVGKTTTVAKLAANYILEAKKKGLPKPEIRMITIDRTRVGAEEQLNKYGEIMNIKVDKAESVDDVMTIFNNFKDSLDYLIIDTSGYSPNDYENIAKMRAMLDVPGLHPDVYLTVMASVKARDLITIIKNYETFNFNSVIVTKCDETTAYGNVLSVLIEQQKSISFITDGQQVPRHIEKASVTGFLTKLNDFNIDRTHIEDTFPEDK